MQQFFKYLALMLFVSLFTACGGGGGSTGSTGSGSNGGTGGTTLGLIDTLLTAQLQDEKGVAVQSVAAEGSTSIVGKLVTKDGRPVAGETLTVDEVFSGNLLFYPNGRSVKTDVNGIGKISVRRLNLFQFGNETAVLRFESTDKYLSSSTELISYPADPPILTLVLNDSSGAVVSSIPSSGVASLIATLKFADGTPVRKKRIEVNGDLTKIFFPEGNAQLTDDSGRAVIKITRAAGVTGGAGTLDGAATISGVSVSGIPIDTVVTGKVDYSVGAVVEGPTLTLDTLDTGVSTLSAYGTRQVSVRAMLGTSVAPSVRVSFSSNCGQISPATALTNASGIASVSFTATDATGTAQSTLGCGGKTVDISASAVGADKTISKTISVLAAPATNLSFVVPTDAAKSRIYLANSGGATQTSVQFLLTNSREEPLPNENVLVSLKTVNGGIPKATFNTVSNVAPVPLTTDSFGKVNVPVFSGTVPTNVVLNAALVSNPAINTDSSVIAIASGRPAQARVSLVRGKAAIRGFNFDGSTTTVTMSLADRQGNPVPDGTVVNFVTEGGVMIPPTCVTGAIPGDSQCSVNIRTQNPRPSDGLVSILAYAAGEEDFEDADFNNVFDCGEKFTDLVTAYRDDADTGSSIKPEWGVPNAFVPGQFTVPRSASTSSCKTGTIPTPKAADGVWGAADVRGQVLVVFSTDDFVITNPKWTSSPEPLWSNESVATGLVVSIADMNGRSVPTGSGISVTVVDNSPKAPSDGDPDAASYGTCQLVSQSHKVVPDSVNPLSLNLNLKQCVAGDQVSVEVTTPANIQTFTFAVPR